MGAAARTRYPTKATIERIVSAARAAGVKVGGFEVDADGTIRILQQTGDAPVGSAYDRWQAKRDKAA